MNNRLRVAVLPTGALASVARLAGALEQAFPVRFQDGFSGDADAIADLFPGDHRERATDRSFIRFAADASDLRTSARNVSFADIDVMDRCLRGRTLADDFATELPVLDPAACDTVLARAGSDPIWLMRSIASGDGHLVAGTLEDLGPKNVLRHHFRGKCFLRLLPLIHFLRQICRDRMWSPPPLRACFVIDDPNLHAMRYGHIDFKALADHGQINNHHVCMATIPLDGWFVNRRVAAHFAQHANRLSLAIHGNSHLRWELGVEGPEPRCRTIVAQALRRIDRLERKAGFPISRVMIAPHGKCSQAMVHAMFDVGVTALCISRPYPWLPAPPPERVLAGWPAADLVEGGFPVIPRFEFSTDMDELNLRGYLGHPLVVYGHHDDLADGFQMIGGLAERINAFGEIRWTNLQTIANTSVATRREGDAYHVKPMARHVDIVAPAWAQELVVHVEPDDRADSVDINDNRVMLEQAEDERIARFRLSDDRCVSCALAGAPTVDYRSVPAQPTGPRAVIRRLLTETRDWLAPYRL